MVAAVVVALVMEEEELAPAAAQGVPMAVLVVVVVVVVVRAVRVVPARIVASAQQQHPRGVIAVRESGLHRRWRRGAVSHLRCSPTLR